MWKNFHIVGRLYRIRGELMADLIREYSGVIIAVALQFVFMVAVSLSAEVARRRLNKELRERPVVLWFTYPTVHKWIFGIGFVVCMLLAPLYAMPAQGYDAWVPMVIFVFGLLGGYGWYYFAGGVMLDTRGVTQVRLWTKTRIEFAEITHVSFHKFGHYLVLHTPKKRIRVEYQLQEYDTFLEGLRSLFFEVRGTDLPSR